MELRKSITHAIAPLAAALALSLAPAIASAHCDTLDGPVVQAARQALDAGNPDPVLIWVRKGDEREIKAAFDTARDIRKLSPAARALADRYFFETLVRVHRQGEGTPYTGLKATDEDANPGIHAADEALASHSSEAMLRTLGQTVEHGARQQFANVMAKKDFSAQDVAAGRDFVAAYVEYIHYIEGIYQASEKTGGHAHVAANPAHAQ